MTNLTPELRADKNGKLVTRHVKQDDGSTGVPLNAPAPSVVPIVDASVAVVPKQRTVVIRPDRLERAANRLEAANKRLQRAGMQEFVWTVLKREENLVPGRKSFGGLIDYVEVVDLVIDYPEVKTSTHEFVGTLRQEESGMLTSLKEGTELGGWRPRESYCDHCGTNRRRNNTYIIKDHETGEYSQVGSSCVEGYLGVDPAHLFSLNFDPLGDEIEDLSKTGSYGSYHTVEHKTDVRKSLAVALVVSNDGADYKKRTSWWGAIPSERIKSDVSTYASVVAGVRDVDEDHPDYEWTQKVQSKAEERLKDGSVDAFITEVLNDPDESEYIQNLKVLLSGDQCHWRNLGLLASAVTVYNRKHKVKAEPKTAHVNEWLGKPDEKLTGINAKVERVRYKENQYGITTIVTMRAESGHELTWFASNSPDLSEGDSVAIKSTTVKEHGEWQGNKNTIVTRTKLEVTSSASTEGESDS